MTNQLGESNAQNVCDLKYLTDTMGGNKNLIKEIMEIFLKQIPEELKAINAAIANADFATIKGFAHTMKSSVSIMGISVLAPVLQEMEGLADPIRNPGSSSIKRIIE